MLKIHVVQWYHRLLCWEEEEEEEEQKQSHVHMQDTVLYGFTDKRNQQDQWNSLLKSDHYIKLAERPITHHL